MLLDVADHREAAGGRDGVAREGVAGLVLDALGRPRPRTHCRPLGQQHGRERRVAARQALPDAEDVRPDVGLLGGEPRAEPAEAGDDLVEDRAGRPSRRTAPRSPRRYSAERACTPAVSITGSTMIAETVLGAFVLDHVAELREAPERAAAGAGAAGARDRRVRVEAAGQERLVRRAQLRPAGRRERAHRRAVVGAVEGDRLVALGAAALAVVLARHLERRLGRLRAAVQLLDDVVAAAGEPDQLGGELERPVGGGHDRRREREPPVLRHDRVDDLVVAVPEADREHPGEAVDVASSLVVGERDPVALDHDQRVGGERLHLVEIDHDVARRLAEVERVSMVGARELGHGAQSSFVRPKRQVRPSTVAVRAWHRYHGFAARVDLSDQALLDRRHAARRPPRRRTARCR